MENGSRSESEAKHPVSRAERVLSFVGLGCLVLGASGIAEPLSMAIFAFGMLIGLIVVHMTCARLHLRIPMEFGCFIIIPMIAVLAATLFPLFARIPNHANCTACQNNLSALHRAMTMYAQEWDGFLTPHDRWNDAIHGSLAEITDLEASRVLRCPSTGEGTDPSYALNGQLKGRRLKNIGKNTVLLFECTPGRNRSGGPELLPPEDMHTNGINILFADGSVSCLPKSEIGKLNWEPKPRNSSAPSSATPIPRPLALPTRLRV